MTTKKNQHTNRPKEDSHENIETLTEKIHALEKENKLLINELSQNNQEKEHLKKLYNEQIKNLTQCQIQSQKSQQFLQVLETLINNSHITSFIPKEISYGLIQVNWENTTSTKNTTQTKTTYTAYQASEFIDLGKYYECKDNQLINTQCSKESILKKTLDEIIEQKSKELFTAHTKKVSFDNNTPFTLTSLIIRNLESQVIGMFFTLTPIYKQQQEISAFLTQNKQLKTHIHKISKEIKQFETLSKRLVNITFKSLQERIEGIIWKKQSIHRLIEQIRSSSEKTKILSFNATIESAKNNIHKETATIVSTEIRELTEKTKTHTIDLQNIINKVFIEINTLQSFKKDLVEYIEHYNLFEKTHEKSQEDLDTILHNVLSCKFRLRKLGY